ncbi:flagellar motor switch protein FliN [Listeria monocytogenes]|uniref:flagellar motor switch protein FliN n=1 Tax=Listeria monocytogenes TaxID=1639 RepID=UPI00057382A5|nr:flagellar motor switch protein FliN [Listeria monocytogenes]EAF3077245.1 flagellar motor switch protein FliN [Listeria monocytogenes serotype 1/2a]EKE4574253.1 flagellar motor switch protein FliN [Listeria monocytogenes serotype 1/2b]AXB13163.1 flagellar motor switch protein FliN [Listeria monocytogenes]EAA0152197.1 flagellar motor switch protein FliN [Listeria monocytogenes]EAA0276928.1 flagellar motor switch protein FliN [Listeria monocytogenes]
MEYFLSLLKIIVLLAVLAGISYFLVKKNKQANRTRKSENDLIKLKDTLLISHQLRAVLLEAEGEKVLAIISNNDIRTVSLKGKTDQNEALFRELLLKEETKENA